MKKVMETVSSAKTGRNRPITRRPAPAARVAMEMGSGLLARPRKMRAMMAVKSARPSQPVSWATKRNWFSRMM